MAGTAALCRKKTPAVLAIFPARWLAEAGSASPAWLPGNPRNKSRRAPAARTRSTAACRNCGNTLPHPHRDGRHTSWIFPPTTAAGKKGNPGEIRSRSDGRGQKLNVAIDGGGAILLIWAARLAPIGSSRRRIRRGRRNGFLIGGRQFIVILPQARLNFVHHAQIADELRAACESQMRLAIRVAYDRCRLQIRQLGMPPGKSRST